MPHASLEMARRAGEFAAAGPTSEPAPVRKKAAEWPTIPMAFRYESQAPSPEFTDGSTPKQNGVPAEGTATLVERTESPAEHCEAADHDDIIRIVSRAKEGDAEAFALLYDRYAALVYRYVYCRVGTRSLAEDLTSETFLRALRRITTFTWQGKDFAAWLVTIARNLVTDHFKSGRSRLEVCTAEMLDADHVDDGPEQAVLDSFTRATLLETIRKLDTDQRDCVVLRFLQGLSVAETALIMNRREGAVKALQYRAVRSLARMFPPG